MQYTPTPSTTIKFLAEYGLRSDQSQRLRRCEALCRTESGGTGTGEAPIVALERAYGRQPTQEEVKTAMTELRAWALRPTICTRDESARARSFLNGIKIVELERRLNPRALQ